MYIWIVSLSADRGLLTQNLIPYSEWADADLLQVLAEKASDTSPEARNERLEILSELANRPQAKRGQAYFALLMDLARRYANLPEENLLSQLMKDACLGDIQLVISLLNEFRDPKVSPHLVACAAKVIRGLPSDAKHRSLRYLTDCLLAQSSTTAVTNAIVDLLRSMDEPELSRETAVTLSPYLLKADPVPVSAAVRVLSKIGDKDLADKMLVVMTRSIEGWYDNTSAEIRSHALDYFARNPHEKALPVLIKILRTSPSEQLLEALRASRYPSVGEMLANLLNECLVNFLLNYDTVFWSLRALSETEAVIDPKIAVSHEAILVNSGLRLYAKKIILKAPDRNKPFLLQLAKDSNPEKFRFAIECLSELGLSPEEQRNLIKGNLASNLYKFFYGEDLRDVWQKKDKQSLGSTFKKAKGISRAEYLVWNLLSAFDLQTLYVDPSGKQGVDVVAISPSTLTIFVVGITSTSPKDDVLKLSGTVNRLREEMSSLMTILDVFQVIFALCPRNEVSSSASDDAKERGVVILAEENVDEIMVMVLAGRPLKEFVEYLRSLR